MLLDTCGQCFSGETGRSRLGAASWAVDKDSQERKIVRPIPRQHHYLPVGYLAGFTPSGRARDRLWVHDVRQASRRDPEQPRVWRSLPAKVARQRDLYTIGSETAQPDLLEHELMKRDDADIRLVRKVCESRQCARDRFDDLLAFVALTYTRSPSMRPMMTRWVGSRTGLPFEEAIRDPESWTWLAQWLSQPLPAIYALVETCAQKAQLWHVLVIDVLKHSILPLLKRRQWSLCVSQSKDYVVCSNSPLGITWPLDHPSGKRPTLGDDRAILTFPLDRHTALVAGLDGPGCGRHVSRDAVAQINSQTVLSLRTHAAQQSFVFAPADRFYCMGNDGLLDVSGTDFTLVSEPTSGA